MRRAKQASLVGGLILACVYPLRSNQNITITVVNSSAFANTYELYDNVCKAAKSDLPLAAHGTSPLTICAADSGYGSFKSRIKGNQTWNNFDLVKSGETKTLN